MAIQKHNDEPGSPAWHARRARCFNAGDASAMLGCHPSGKTRTQLLQELHTGLQSEFSDYVQERVIAPGHRIEALWRPMLAEPIIGEDLQVLAYTLDVGLSRPLGASLDAITFMEDVSGECKSANDALRAALPHAGRDSHTLNDARQLPKGYRVQMEQQQMASGATRTLFSACQFNADGSVAEERHCWYLSDPALRREIMAGWMQFDVDLAAYVPPAAAAPAVVAAPVQALPAVSVVVDGTIAIRHNLPAFEVALRDFLDHRLIRAPKTDQDFADLDVQIKAMKGAEAALESAETNWIAQLDAVATAKRQKDMLLKLTRDNRLMAEKLLATEKERRRGEIVAGGIGALKAHIDALNKRLGKPYMPATASAADFGAAIRGKKSLASMEDAVATTLAAAKINANEIADRIDANLKTLRELAADHPLLFADAAQLVLKPVDDCRSLVSARISEHKAAEERRLETDRARIRAEEEARARAQAQREQQEREAAERRQREEAQAAQRRQEQEAAALESRQREEDAARAERQRQEEALRVAGAAGADPDPEVVKLSTVAQMPAKHAGPPTLKLGEIKRRIAPLDIDAAGLAFLGFPPVDREGAAKLYREESFPAICAALISHITASLQQRAA